MDTIIAIHFALMDGSVPYIIHAKPHIVLRTVYESLLKRLRKHFRIYFDVESIDRRRNMPMGWSLQELMNHGVDFTREQPFLLFLMDDVEEMVFRQLMGIRSGDYSDGNFIGCSLVSIPVQLDMGSTVEWKDEACSTRMTFRNSQKMFLQTRDSSERPNAIVVFTREFGLTTMFEVTIFCANQSMWSDDTQQFVEFPRTSVNIGVTRIESYRFHAETPVCTLNLSDWTDRPLLSADKLNAFHRASLECPSLAYYNECTRQDYEFARQISVNATLLVYCDLASGCITLRHRVQSSHVELQMPTSWLQWPHFQFFFGIDSRLNHVLLDVHPCDDDVAEIMSTDPAEQEQAWQAKYAKEKTSESNDE